mmetsp:Transcript_79323/g.145153  ORF Transcript_79323/g.145153 Transcript_79323/m.145153 type:complete len:171 (+) Transcript_79323:3-515(+)
MVSRGNLNHSGISSELQESKFLRLPSTTLADLRNQINRSAGGCPGFGMVVLAGKERKGGGSSSASHVLLFYASHAGQTQFVDVSQQQPQDRIFSSLEKQRSLYDSFGLQTSIVFYLFCSGQIVHARNFPNPTSSSAVRHSTQAGFTSGLIDIIKRSQALTQLTLGCSQRG